MTVRPSSAIKVENEKEKSMKKRPSFFSSPPKIPILFPQSPVKSIADMLSKGRKYKIEAYLQTQIKKGERARAMLGQLHYSPKQ